MSNEIQICYHSNEEEQYTCLNTSCVEKHQLKLECLACLQKSHPHDECIYHNDQIKRDSENNKMKLLDLIEQNILKTDTLLQQCDDSFFQIKQDFDRLIDNLKVAQITEIKKYQKNLQEHQDLLNFSNENLTDNVKLKTYNFHSYQTQNDQIISQLTLNLNYIQHQSNKFIDQLKEVCKIQSISDQPKLEQQFCYPTTPEYEQCKELGCANIIKNQFCLEKDCLKNCNPVLECPSCLTNKHCIQNCYKKHRPFVINGVDLWKKQNLYITDVRAFCNLKTQQVEDLIRQFQLILSNYLKSTEENLSQFLNFMLEKQRSILKSLKDFQSKFQTDKFVIYKELLQERDYSKLAGITQLDGELNKIAFKFKAMFEEMNSQDFQELWIKPNEEISERNSISKIV